jgi:hypothetical protein
MLKPNGFSTKYDFASFFGYSVTFANDFASRGGTCALTGLFTTGKFELRDLTLFPRY